MLPKSVVVFLGSTAYTVNGTTETGEVCYLPWGKDRFTSGATPTSYKFTGQREESSIGLYYYGARWYDPALGRFIQPDTIVSNPGDAQSFDRYAYALNNPLRYSDPTGHYSRDEVIQHFGCAENDWGCVDALFDNSNKDSLYRGAGEWLQILLDAVDGDVVTAWNPNAQAVMTGQFLRNAATGAIGIQMVMSDGQLTGPIHESAFAAYGAGKPYVGGYNYAMQRSKHVQTVGQVYHLPGACGAIWDCTALGLDSASLLLSTGGEAMIGCVVESLGLCGAGAIAAKTADTTVTYAAVAHTVDMVVQGKAGPVDAAMVGLSTRYSTRPVLGEIFGVAQLLYDFIVDPLTPGW